MLRLTLDHLPRRTCCTYCAWTCRRLSPGELHCHEFFELFWVEAGMGVHWVNGRREVLRRGDLVLVRDVDVHSLSAARAGEPLRFVNVAFKREIWEEMRSRCFGGRQVFFAEPRLGRRTYRLGDSELARVRQLAIDLHQGLSDRLAAEAFLAGLLGLLARRASQNGRDGVPDWLEQAARLVRQYPNFVEGVSALVRLSGRSPEHVARMAQKYLHRRPCDLVNDARMEHAASLLGETDRPILEIAFDCGVENVGHFYRLFQKQFGCAPAHYRRRRRAAMENS